MRKLAKALGAEHQLSVANSSLTNRTVERMMREVMHGAKTILNAKGRPLSKSGVVLLAEQWAWCGGKGCKRPLTTQ